MSEGYVYIRTEPGLWTTGHYTPSGQFEPEADHESPAIAARRAHWLNGGCNGEATCCEEGL